MISSLARLAVGLQAIAQLAQEIADQIMANHVADAAQTLGQFPQTFRCPQQRRFGIAARRRIDQTTKIIQQRIERLKPQSDGRFVNHAAIL